jgi:hypothetical protein
MDDGYSTGSLVTIACAVFAATLTLDNARHKFLKSWVPYLALSVGIPALHDYLDVPWSRLWMCALVLVSWAAAYGQHRYRLRRWAHFKTSTIERWPP